MPDSAWSDADLALLHRVYDLQTKSRMNVLYYDSRLGRLKTFSFWMDVVIAITASGSGVASQLQAKSWGLPLWTALSLTAAFISIVRPIYSPGKKIENFSSQLQGYRANYFALTDLAVDIRQEGYITDDHRNRYRRYNKRYVGLSAGDESPPKLKLLERCQQCVEGEIQNNIWWPPGVQVTAQPTPPLQAVDRKGLLFFLRRVFGGRQYRIRR